MEYFPVKKYLSFLNSFFCMLFLPHQRLSQGLNIFTIHQNYQPGIEKEMKQKPISDDLTYSGSNKLKDKIAVITGGDSGIGKAIAIAFAKEGADVVIMYLNEDEDANDTKEIIENDYGRKALLISGDIGNERFCKNAVNKIIKEFGKINILVNNAGEHQPSVNLENISAKQLQRTFETNLFGAYYLTQFVLPYLHKNDTIINTTSVVAYKGNEILIDYAATKGALVAFTRSLALNLAKRGIRVNAVAPGPIWTPLITSSFSSNEVAKFGKDVLMRRPGQPAEIAPSFVFLASNDSSYMTGQVLHPNGGTIVGG